MSKPSKYVVILEIPSTGYIDCIGIYENAEQAYGEAYLSLCDGVVSDNYYITSPMDREGKNGCYMSVVDKDTKEEGTMATILFYMEEVEE